MLMGLPCITTSLANNALQAEENKSILIAATPSEFVAHIENLIQHKGLYQEISENGKRWVAQTYSWESSVKKLTSLFHKES